MILSTITTFSLACAALVAGAVERDPFTGAVPVLHYSFEKDQDTNHDRQPDDWTRRKGPKFPSYIETGIDRNQGHHQPGEPVGQSLRFKVNGGRATIYSPAVRITPLHSYVFHGYVRTQLLKHDAALISVSFLNHKRQRVQRFLTRPVSGTHRDWVRVRIGPFAPDEEVRFVVIGCHLINGKRMDIRGSVWFDDLRIGKLPQLSLASNFRQHFVDPTAKIQITSNVSGLDPGHKYQLRLQIFDSNDRLIKEIIRELKADPVESNDRNEETSPKPQTIDWPLPSQSHGFYRAIAVLERDGKVIHEKQTSFAVMDVVKPGERGEFGWSIAQNAHAISLEELADVAAQAGINWLKYPLWQSVYSDDQELPAELTQLFSSLVAHRITPVGLLNNPSLEMRNKFARDWTGISEIFTMPSSFWLPSLEPVIARYSSNVRYWQLGGESDASFVGMKSLPEALANVKSEIDRIGRDTRIGLHWDWKTPLPSSARMPRTFLSVSSDPPMDERQLLDTLRSSARSGLPRWVLLKPLSRTKHTPQERGSDLVKRMVAAKIGGAEAIFAFDVFHKEYGLMYPSGAPTRLFLPWRTTALSLRGSEYLGSFALPSGSRNYAFARDNEVVLIVWNHEPTTENIYLGEDVKITDLWGRQRPTRMQEGTNQQTIDIDSTPLVIRGCSEPIARWRMGVRFEKGLLASQHGGQTEAILGENTFPQGVNVKVVLNIPREWEVDRKVWQVQMGPAEKFKLPMVLTLPPNASLGVEVASIDFEIDQTYKFRVYRSFKVGLGDVQMHVVEKVLEDGRLEIVQTITNHTSPAEVLNFRCNLFVPGSKRLKHLVTKLGKGRQDVKRFYISNAEAFKGKQLWLRAEQINGRRVLNYRWIVGQNEEE